VVFLLTVTKRKIGTRHPDPNPILPTVWGGVAALSVNGRLPNAFPPPKEASAVKRIRDIAGKSALVTAALAVVLSACSTLSPSTISDPYPAADGINVNLPGSTVALRNFLVIGAAKGAPAVVVGALVNNGPTEVEVALQADLGETAQPTQTVVRVGANSSVQLGPDQKFEMSIPQLPVEPGATTTLSAATTAGGRTELTVPVLRPENEYTALTPAPTTPAATSTPTPTAKAKAKKSGANETPDPTETPEPTDT